MRNQEQYDADTRWTDRIISSSGDWSGNVCDFYFRVYNKLIQDIKVPFKMDGGTRVDDTPVHQALREALANCLVNADYYGRQGLVIIKKRNAITMSNPGSFRIEIDAAKSGGIPAIFRVWREQGWREPVIEKSFEPDRTVLLLSLLKKESSDKGAKTAAQKIASLNILPIMLLQSARTFPICLVLKTHAQDGCSVR